MKVLFAVSDESISESIIKKYQQEYKEIISSKNVYYFNAIAKELQKDKTYDRIVISEDLEPFANNNYEVIDKFIFEKLDAISDEATSSNGQDIPIILICADRRGKSESLLVKIFGIGIYSALLGQDRSVTKVCELINKPRSKKDAKIYYRVDSEDVGYKAEGEGDVSEIEIQNILNHYKRLGRNAEKYVESFDNIATQYTDTQLRVICKFLPLDVRAVLESNSQKYQELITFGTVTPSISVRGGNKAAQAKYVPNSDYESNKNRRQDVGGAGITQQNIGQSNLTRPVVIPSTRNISEVKRVTPNATPVAPTAPASESLSDIDKMFEDITPTAPTNEAKEPIFETIDSIEPAPISQTESVVATPEEPPKKRRGRPRKVKPEETVASNVLPGVQETAVGPTEEPPKKKRGRPRKVKPEEAATSSVLPGVQEAATPVNLYDLQSEEKTGGIILPGFDEDEEEEIVVNEPVVQTPTYVEPEIPRQEQMYTPANYARLEPDYRAQNPNTREIQNTREYYDINLENLLTRDKKVVAFVGTSKNGTSFLVNNLAETMSKKGIRTAVLDLTQNKNAYYIYTQNEEELRRKAFSCVANLRNGIADGIQVNKNLTVYTTLPKEDGDLEDYQSILQTLAQNYSLVLMDCDFDTNYGYFKNAQEIYLVQSYDILTIQPLTAFLRDLKTKNILQPEKLRIVLNKVLRVRTITERTIIGGIAFYNDPAMSFMTELFNKDTIKYCTIPFEEQTYSRYLEGLVNCQISTNGYSKNFMMSLEKLSNMVYPLLANSKNVGKVNSYQGNGFSNNMNDTLNRMKRNY